MVFAQNALLIPDTLSGTNIDLTLQTGTHQFYSGQITNTMGVNGNILGPTLILNQGDFVNFSVNNQLDEVTTIHWHGMHVSAKNDGGPHTTIPANTSWQPSFTVLDKAGTYWYHPHLHEKTNEHVSKGIAGLILVRDQTEAGLNLPRTYGVDDFPLVIQSKDFDTDNQIIVHSNSDDVVMVNATIDPFLNVPAQIVRYRILNGSSQRAFNFGLNDNQVFYQIASDGGLFPEPIEMTRLLLASGERAEILIDFTGKEGKDVFLKSFASELENGIYGAQNAGRNSNMTLNGYNPNPLNGGDFDIMTFKIIAQNSNPITSIPSELVEAISYSENDVSTVRKLTFTPEAMGMNQLNGRFLINDVSFDINVVNQTVMLDDVEIWELDNRSAMAHPFHIHDVQFYILTRNGLAPPINEQGRKDVVLVKPQETVRFITKFETFADDVVPYMYHCHLLTHEDDGMMGQFIVKSNDPVGIKEDELNGSLIIYPNPSKGSLQIEFDANLNLNSIEIYDALGRVILDNIKVDISKNKVQIEGLPKGLFLLKMRNDKQVFVRKIIVK